MNVLELGLFTACLISTDILISTSVTRFKNFPTVFTIILGAGLWNDSVVVVLTQAMSDNLCPNKGEFDEEGNCQNLPRVEWKPETPWLILG